MADTENTFLTVRGVAKSYDQGRTQALSGVSFALEAGQSLAVLGPSGCGKSTLLRLIAGLETLDAGEIAVEGASLAGIPPHRRGFGLMHQDLALFPHLNVRANIAFGLRSQKWDEQAMNRRVDDLLDLMRIESLASRPVEAISGGEQQRVALARSLAPRPRLLMLDEPLGALDRRLREELTQEIRHIRDREGATLIYVTHDHDEAFAVADEIMVLSQGTVAQYGPPEDVWLAPASPFVARFLGHRNLFPCKVSPRADGRHGARGPLGVWHPDHPAAFDGAGTVLIPPEAVTLQADRADGISAVVGEVTLQGGGYDVTLDVGGVPLAARVPVRAATDRPQPGAAVTVTIDWRRARLLNWSE